MDKETLDKLCGLLGMTHKQLAEESGYSLDTINSIFYGRLKVSARLEQFLKLKLMQMAANKDPALEFIFQTLGK